MGNAFYRSNRRPDSKLKVKKIWTWLILLVLLICGYIGVFHSHRYYGFNIVLWLSIIGTVSLYALYMIWLDHGKWRKLKSFLFGIFVCIPAAALVIFLHNLFVDNQLAGHELRVDGVVTELYERSSKNRSTPYAVFSYPANGRIWTQDIINKGYALGIGDTLTIVCSELDPEVFVRINK